MRIHLITIGNRVPDWVQQGYHEYAKRLPSHDCELLLKEIAPGRRGKNCDVARVVRDEGSRMLAAIPPQSHVIALDRGGHYWNSEQLADSWAHWQTLGQDVSLLIGGPDGLSNECKSRTAEYWSLSRLTFPHPLVRIIVAEQLYRAWSILRHRPYHR